MNSTSSPIPSLHDIKIIRCLTEILLMEFLPKKVVLIQKPENTLLKLTGQKKYLKRNRYTRYRFLTTKLPSLRLILENRYLKKKITNSQSLCEIKQSYENNFLQLVDYVYKEVKRLGFQYPKSWIRDFGFNCRIKEKIKQNGTNYPNTDWGSTSAPYWKKKYGQ